MSSHIKLTTTWKPSNIHSNSINNPKKICSKLLPGKSKRPIRRSRGPISSTGTSRNNSSDWSKLSKQCCKKNKKRRGRRRRHKGQKREEG
jgi:hypothetical protein